ncbi:MAG TPA: exodeoxyribonuclease V subunit beta [Candidatus Aquabacterium excrementipullorum]|nr:exodeoxyribonuclease V subunit beta [Candidatus Aquabacterium excrementipullorum]
MPESLDPLRLPLHGSRLIEASAGTGKTWTIAALYLRLVLGHGDEDTAPPRPLLPAEVLVMTFTRAATRELSDRIRQRLMQAALCFRGEAPVPEGDALLAGLLDAYPDAASRSRAAWRLAQAADAMDEAAIHTIDAWCQRMLREHAFDSGQLFDETLLPDEQPLREQAVRDYWREALYPLDAQSLSQALAVWPSVEALDQDVKGLLPRLDAAPATEDEPSLDILITQGHQRLRDDLAALKAGWPERVVHMRQWLDEQCARKPSPFNGTRLRAGYYGPWLDQLAAWADDPDLRHPDLPDAARRRLVQAGMEEALSGKAEVDGWPDHFECFATLLAALEQLPDPGAPMRWHAARWVQARLQELKRQAGVYGFADMLQRLVDALQGPHADRLRQRILDQYPAALIDEFQDTSPLQYRLFDLLYRVADNDPERALFLIGDPKQSIYRFRGADIYSYLQARQATQGRHAVLGTNHRSTQALVAAVNRVFEQAEQRAGRGAFAFRHPGVKGDGLLPFDPVDAKGRAEVLRDHAGALPALRLVLDAEPSSKEAAHRRMAGHAAEFIVGLLSDARTGLYEASALKRRLRPADIAVLVRSGTEAEVVRQALRRRGVPSVYLSDKDSVFDSAEARDLLAWLRAVASPRDLRLARSAHAAGTLGLTLQELLVQAHDDELWDERLAELRRLQLTWQRQGVLAMLRQTIHRLGLAARWLAQPQGERRITNVLHLAELLQAASIQAQGEQGLIRWLAQRVGDHGEGDERIVRLESDADLVQVVTVHKSKGLEYPVVVMPFAGSVRQVARGQGLFDLVEADGQRRIALSATEDEVQAADLERLREDLRLMYVALTRPRHALWLGVSAVRQGNAKSLVLPHSALGHLLGAPEDLGAEGIAPLLSDWLTDDGAVVIEHVGTDAAFTPLPIAASEAALRPAPVYNAAFERDWAIGSFSSIVRDLPATGHGAVLVPLSARQEAVLAGDDSTDLRQPDAANATTDADQPWHRFPRGALPGNFLHEQMEWLAGEGFALAGSPGLTQGLRRRCERQGWAHLADDVLHWLQAVASVTLPPLGTSLQGLRGTVPEMEFWLPSQHLPVARVDALCQAHLWPGQSRPALPERHLKGMLMGFADLVFEHEGRYWVMDYKSTTLGLRDADYHAQALTDAMLRHRYDVQAALYLLALHRLLASRLGEAYDPAEQLGGAVFLFMRGVAGPERGCCLVPAQLELLEGLEQALAGHAQTTAEEARR